MTQQDAQKFFNEKMIAFQRATEFPNGDRFTDDISDNISAPIYDHTLLGIYHHTLTHFSPVGLKLSTDEYYDTASLPENGVWTLRQTGIILQILESSTPYQCGIESLYVYRAMQNLVSSLSEEWRAIVAPYADELNAEIQAMAAAEKAKAEAAKGKTESGYSNKVFAPATPKAEA